MLVIVQIFAVCIIYEVVGAKKKKKTITMPMKIFRGVYEKSSFLIKTNIYKVTTSTQFLMLMGKH